MRIFVACALLALLVSLFFVVADSADYGTFHGRKHEDLFELGISLTRNIFLVEGTWQPMPNTSPAPSAGTALAGALCNDQHLYIFGGQTELSHKSSVDELWKYDIGSSQFFLSFATVRETAIFFQPLLMLPPPLRLFRFEYVDANLANQ
jgi:hypothetical protein